ncbi:MAG: DUF86 domain-containing protein [Proteobacteria bacterium]|nr:DUF86 domain-containing protein [Pseudomonadota bacterium]
MPSRHDPAACLAEIVENADRIRVYLSGIDRAAFIANGMVRDATERCLERICEAAHRLGDDAAALMPGRPWGDIRSMGNWLRHAYDRISADVIWNTALHDIPGLAADARAVLASLRSGGPPSAL